MADLRTSRTLLRGLLVPDERLTLDSTESSYTEAGPIPPIPVASGITEAALVASGSPSGSRTITVRATDPGMPGPDGAGLTWTPEGGLERGWDPPHVTQGHAIVTWAASTSWDPTPGGTSTVTLSDGTVLLAYGAHNSGTAFDSVRVKSRDPDTGVWSSEIVVAVWPEYSGSHIEAHPQMVVLPSGQILCYYIREEANGYFQVSMSYSDDGGATWSLGARRVLSTTYIYSAESIVASGTYSHVTGLAVAATPSGIALVIALRLSDLTVGASNCRDVLGQWASVDLGTSFSLVYQGEATGATLCGASPALLAVGDGVLLAYTSYSGATPDIYGCVLPNVTTSYATLSAELFDTGLTLTLTTTANSTIDAAGTGDYVSDGGSIALVLESDGAICCYWVAVQGFGNQNQIHVDRSTDGGTTWVSLGTSYGTAIIRGCVYQAEASGLPLRSLSASSLRAQILLTHRSDSDLGSFLVGGWTTACMPSVEAVTSIDTRANWNLTYLPFDLPDSAAWGASGAATVSLTGSGLRLQSAVSARLYTWVPSATLTQTIIVRTCLTPVTGTAASDQIILTVLHADGVAAYRTTLRIGTASIVVRDDFASAGAGSTLGTVTLDTTGGVEVLVAIRGAQVATWVRLRTWPGEQEWTVGPASSTLTDEASYAAASAANQVKFGQTVSTTESYWHSVLIADRGDSGLDFGPSTSDVFGAPLAGAGGTTYIADGISLSGTDGPLLLGQSWTLAPRHSYALSRALAGGPASPRLGWRSTSSAENRIVLALDEGLLAAASRHQNALIGIALIGTGGSIRTGLLEGRASGGSYTTLASFDASTGLSGLAYTRDGNTLVASGSANPSPYFFFDELSGFVAHLGGGAIRRVRGNAEGRWNNTNGKPARIILEGMDGTEPASGTLVLVPTSFAILVRVNNTPHRALRLTLSAQSTIDSRFEIGTLVAGPVVVHGDETSWGRVIETESNVRVTRADDGTDRTRVLGPPARKASFAWVDGVDTSTVFGTAPVPDWITSTSTGGAGAVASVGDTPYQLDGLLRRLDGPASPIVYLPNIPIGTPDIATLNRRHQLMLARMTDSIRLEQAQGDENIDEVLRITSVPLTEIV